MKLDKLLKKMKRDLAASPQKAGALGLMMLVALYFWAPLMLKWTKGKSAKGGGVAASKVILTDDPVLAKMIVHAATDSGKWDRARQSLAKDTLMTAAVRQVSWTNPFGRLHEQTEQPSEEAITKPLTSQTPIPEPLAETDVLTGVTISSLLLSKRDSAVVIRGTVYRKNDTFTLAGDEDKPALDLKVVGIDHFGVDMEHQGRKFRIERSRPKLSPGDQLRKD